MLMISLPRDFWSRTLLADNEPNLNISFQAFSLSELQDFFPLYFFVELFLIFKSQ